MPEQRPGSMEAVSRSAIQPLPGLMDFFRSMDPKQLMDLLPMLQQMLQGQGRQQQIMPFGQPSMQQMPQDQGLKGLMTNEY